MLALDPRTGHFSPAGGGGPLAVPRHARIYSVNEGNAAFWDGPALEYVQRCKDAAGGARKPYSLRYVGTMVADCHRTLLYGGVFLYPAEPGRNAEGKLRVLYEGHPLALVFEEAGGAATTGSRRLLDFVPTSLHARSPVVIGSVENVEAVAELYRAAAQGADGGAP